MAVFAVVACGSAGAKAAPSALETPSALVVETSPEVTYGDDSHAAPRCSGDSSQLHYVVLYPSSPGPHPIVFGMVGTGFSGAAGCNRKTGLETYRRLDAVMKAWAQAGFVAVNIEYHGYSNGLYGDLTYPGAERWGDHADATVELDIKPAMRYFLSHQPGQYGADPSAGIVVFGSSSGAHNAYMVGATGIGGYKIAAVVAWSGLPDVADAGDYARSVFDRYMRTTAGSDVENFGDVQHRLQPGSPAQYTANGLTEFISANNAESYEARCQSLRLAACWLRIPNTSAHAQGYSSYVFTGQSPEVSEPAATPGATVLQDSIAFAHSRLG